MHRSTKLLATTTLALVAAVLVLVVARSHAGPEKVAFPAGDKDGVLYTIADRYDITAPY